VSATVFNLRSPAASENLPGCEEIARLPFYLTSAGADLSAWLHLPAIQTPIDHGVILCSPIGYEHLHSYRGLRHLADSLAAQGIPTLRFDWHGTGDSPGSDRDPDRMGVWQQNLRDAIDWMKHVRGSRRISLVGLRLGATLAALVAEHQEIDNLVCWAPIPKGRAFVRELQAIDLTGEARVHGSSTDAIEAGGFLMTPETAEAIGRVNLAGHPPKCRRVLMLSNPGSNADRKLTETFRTGGLTVDVTPLSALAEMLTEPHRSRVPLENLGYISRWLARHARELAQPLELADLNLKTVVQSPGCREELLRISSEPDLFGILCEPDRPFDRTRPTILLLNAGATTRIGPGRLNVHLARRLAAEGFRSLRLDFQGLGDSLQPDFAKENDSYASTAFRDVQIALEFLRRERANDRTVLLGLCSGAYAAFQSGVQLRDQSIVESILINPLTYFWRDGMTIDDDPARQLVRQHYYRSAMRDPAKWIRFFTGRSRTGFLGAARMIARRIELSLQPRPRDLSPATACETDIPGHPSRQNLPADLETAARRGRHLSMFFAESDPGYMILNHFAKRTAKRLNRAGKIDFRFIPNADHTFSREAARGELIDNLIAHLKRRYPA